MTDMAIERARAGDLPAVLALLAGQNLPTDGIDQHLGTALVARHDGQIVGIAAIEVYADQGLLRSVAVASDVQGRGVGRALVEAALGLARNAGLHTLYLLTTTAERYFPKLGFESITRDDVPAAVQSSVEFTTACPSSAAVMRRRI